MCVCGLSSKWQTPVNNTHTDMPTAKQHMVLQHHQHEHHLYPQPQHQQEGHKDAWHQFEGLVFALIFIHVAAFGFWAYLLYKSRAARADTAKGGNKAAAGAAGSTAAGTFGKSPKDILKAYQKAQLGKA